eukprot:3215030-Pleurochrysis_carterae.AAC.1
MIRSTFSTYFTPNKHFIAPRISVWRPALRRLPAGAVSECVATYPTAFLQSGAAAPAGSRHAQAHL